MWTLSIRWVHDRPQIFIRLEIINLKKLQNIISIYNHTCTVLRCGVSTCLMHVWVCGCVCDCASYLLHMICLLYYWVQQLVMPWWAESQRNIYGIVVMFVCVCVCLCVILQRAFLHDSSKLSNENYNATTTWHSTTSKLARFLLWGSVV